VEGWVSVGAVFCSLVGPDGNCEVGPWPSRDEHKTRTMIIAVSGFNIFYLASVSAGVPACSLEFNVLKNHRAGRDACGPSSKSTTVSLSS
jgi:hypothetical protein